jgi:PAS domain S-box-containing protein
MSLYLVLPLFACVTSSVLATVIFCRSPNDRASRDAVLLLIGGAFWAACEVLLSTRTNPDSALALVKASSLGWVWIGPLGIRLLLQVTGEPARQVRRALPVLITVGGLFVLVDWSTSWLHTGVVRTSWGWGYELGPAYALYYLYAVSCIAIALRLGWRAFHATIFRRGDVQARWIGCGVLIPMGFAALTDGLLPMLGVHVPRLGTFALAVLGGSIVWSFYRYGYSFIAPGTLAGEILETLPDSVAMLRLDGRIRSGNTAMAELLGCEARELAGLDVAQMIHGLPGPLAGEMIEVECEVHAFGGDVISVSLSSTMLRDRQGSPIGFVLVARDLRELEALRRRLVVSGRLAAVGELAAGIAHEINNPLAYVRANLGLLRQHWETLGSHLEKSGEPEHSEQCEELLAEGAEMIDESLQGVDRASAIVRDVKGLAHAGRGERTMADLNELLEGVLRMAAPQLRRTAVVEKQYDSLPLIPCAPQELQQVFLNLVLNAGQAITGHGTITIRTKAEADAIVVWITDNGCGIPPELVDRIFDPFFTTKSVGEGTGLGLGIAHEIVRKHAGEISVDSTSERGTSFCVRLPVSADTIDPT